MNTFSNTVPLIASAAAGVSGASVADNLWIFPVPFKCEVRRCAILWRTTGAAQAIVEFDRRILAGSDSGRVNIVAITKGAVESQGKYIYKDPATKVTLDVGDEVVIEVTDLEAASTFWPVVLVEEIPEAAANQSDAVASV